MTAVRRRSVRNAISASTILADLDDLDGTTDNSQVLDITGANGVLIIQSASDTDNASGIDVIEISRDGGISWAAHDQVLAAASNSFTGTVLVGGALNAAGVEPTLAHGYHDVFKMGPVKGPAMLRCGRKTTTTTGTTWTTGAPQVEAIKF